MYLLCKSSARFQTAFPGYSIKDKEKLITFMENIFDLLIAQLIIIENYHKMAVKELIQ